MAKIVLPKISKEMTDIILWWQSMSSDEQDKIAEKHFGDKDYKIRISEMKHLYYKKIFEIL